MPARRREPLARDLPAELQVAAATAALSPTRAAGNTIDFVMGWSVGNFGRRTGVRSPRKHPQTAKFTGSPQEAFCGPVSKFRTLSSEPLAEIV
jgi:hypothetical protein